MAVCAPEELVALAYLLADMLGSPDDARSWLRTLCDGDVVGEHLPGELTADNRALLAERLAKAGVARDGLIDRHCVDEVDQVLSLVPLMALMETQRIPKPRPSLVCTLPVSSALLERGRHFGRSLAMLVADALRSVEVDGRVLIASPFWSPDGCGLLKPALQRAHTLRCPVTLAGASRVSVRDGGYDYHRSMCDFAGELAAEGYQVACLGYEPPDVGSLFHAKAVCGTTGYLGSGNLTAAGLERNVEIGVPLAPVDVAEVWGLIEQLRRAGLLVSEAC